MGRREAESGLMTPPAGPRHLACYCVSTDKQGRSGLGLEAQREVFARQVAAAVGVVIFAFEEVDQTGRISKCGDNGLRTPLHEAANVVLTRTKRPSALQTWGHDLAQRSWFKQAQVAVARKLSVILNRMWRERTPFRPAGTGASRPNPIIKAVVGRTSSSPLERGRRSRAIPTLAATASADANTTLACPNPLQAMMSRQPSTTERTMSPAVPVSHPALDDADYRTPWDTISQATNVRFHPATLEPPTLRSRPSGNRRKRTRCWSAPMRVMGG